MRPTRSRSRHRFFLGCRTLAFLSVSLVAGALLAANLPNPKEKWIEVKTENFTLYSDDTELATRNIGLNLERLRKTLSILFERMKVNSPVPTYIYVFKNTKSFKRYVYVGDSGSQAKVGGLFVGGSLGNYVAINSGGSGSRFGIVYHEYIHYFLRNNTFKGLPLWFNEGMAEYYTTFLTRENEVTIGYPVERHARALKRQPLIPLEKLFRVTSGSAEYDEVNRDGTFYAQSWALVHYLVSGAEQRANHLNQFLKLLEEDVSMDKALHRAFGMSPNDVEKELAKYIRKGHYPYKIYDFEDLSVGEAVQVKRLEYSDVLYRLGDYLAHRSSERSSDAKAHFRKALELNADHAPSQAGMGYLLDQDGRFQEAGKYFERAVNGDSNNALTQFFLGRNLIMQHQEHPLMAGDTSDSLPRAIDRARSHLRKSIELNPDFEPAYEYYDQTENLAYEVFFRMLRSGNRRSAEKIERDILRHSKDRDLVRHVREVLLQETVNEAISLSREGQHEEAIARVDSVLKEIAEDKLDGDLEASVRETREVLVHNQLVTVYNRAVKHTNAGEYGEALKILQEIVPKITNFELKQAAEDLLQQLRDVEVRGRGR